MTAGPPPAPAPPGDPALASPRPALQAPHAPSPQDTSGSAPARPQPILPPNSISLLPFSPSSAPRPTHPGATDGKRPGGWAGPDLAGPATPLARLRSRACGGWPGSSSEAPGEQGPGGRGCGCPGLLTRSWRNVGVGAPPGLRNRTRPGARSYAGTALGAASRALTPAAAVAAGVAASPPWPPS